MPRTDISPSQESRADRAVPVTETEAARPVISAKALTGYRELVRSMGGCPEQLLGLVGIDPEDCGREDGTIPFGAYSGLLELTSKALDVPHFGMRLADQQDYTKLVEPIAKALTSSATLGDFFRCGTRYMYTYTSGALARLDKLDDQIFLMRIDVLETGLPYRRQAMEHLLTVAHDCATMVTEGRIRAREIWFAHDAIAEVRLYQRRHRAKIRFSQPVNALLFFREDMDFAIASRDEAILESELRALPQRFPQPRKHTALITEMIHSEIGRGDCSRDTIAAKVGLTPRTLYRRLLEERTTFDVIQDDVRRNLALGFLAQSKVRMTEIAARLGYAEPAVFSRACRRWFGVSPRELRRSLAQAQPRMDS
jgi:AraC-like DNA-binding protein